MSSTQRHAYEKAKNEEFERWAISAHMDIIFGDYPDCLV